MTVFLRAFGVFQRLLGWRFQALLAVTFVAVFFEGLSLATFFPVLQMAGGNRSSVSLPSFLQNWASASWGLGLILGALVLFFLLRSVFLIAQTAYAGKMEAELLMRLREETMTRLFAAPYSFYMSKDAGYLNNAFSKEFEGIAFSFNMFNTVVVKLVFVLLYLGCCLKVTPGVTAACLAAGALVFPFVKMMNRAVKKYSVENSKASADFLGLFIQAIQNFKYFKATETSQRILARVRDRSRLLGRIRYKLALDAGISQYGLQPVAVAMIAGVLYFQLKDGRADLAGLMFVLILLQRTISELLGLQINFRKFLVHFGSLEVYNDLSAELDARAPAPSRAGLAAPGFREGLALEDVWFSYTPGRPVLKGISLRIPARATVAFVGGSGAGKSTLANLLTGLITPEKGRLVLDGAPFDQLDAARLRRQVGYITQESVMFNDTVLNNVCLWDSPVDAARYRAALDKAHVRDLVENLPQADGTVLGDNGIKISGGQRQRIAIARELYKDVKLLIFDEATSSLDGQTEAMIQADIDALHGDKTVVLIAHRLSTVKNSDIIFVLKDGQVVESGSYEDLMARGSEFRTLLASQQA